MKIGLVGAGHIGTTLARTLAAAGHDVKVANSRGPDSVAAKVLETGARAVTVEGALADVDVAILSIPQVAFAGVRDLVAALPDETVVIDTSNYFPQRDGENTAIEAGQVESEWVSAYFGRPITKAWNAIGTDSFKHRPQLKGHPDRVAVPVAGDRARDREIGIALMNDTGFDGFDAGPLAESWRQQPGSPVYCTDLTYDEVAPALAAAERDRLPKRRDLSVLVFGERLGGGVSPDWQSGVKISRALFM